MDKKIYIFTETQNYAAINTTLTDIAEPISKPAHINEFEINSTSLLRAKALGYTYERIFHFLNKHMISPPISSDLKALLQSVIDTKVVARLFLIEEREKNYYVFEYSSDLPPENPIHQFLREKYRAEEREGVENNANSWIVKDYQHNELAKFLFEKDIPVLSEKLIEYNQIQQEMHRNAELYRSKNALHCKNLKIELKAFTKLREYQS
jgi:hypothetical protein